MNRRLILTLAILLLLATVLFMASDFFFGDPLPESNPYEYNIDAFKEVDPALINWVEVQQINSNGDSLKSLAVDIYDNIYIGTHHKLLIYSNEGHLKNEIEMASSIYSIHVAADGKIYVALKDHIEVWNRSGRRLQSWEAKNSKSVLTSISSKESVIFIADAGNRVVYQYDLEGNWLKDIGLKNEDLGSPGFIIPSPFFDLLVGRDDELWVVNPGRHQFESYHSNGQMISSWNKTSMQLDGFSGCCNPTHIAMLSDGAFVTSEKGIERVKIHQPDGNFLEVVASPDAFVEGTTGLDLAVDSEDRILILDNRNAMVRIFVRKTE